MAVIAVRVGAIVVACIAAAGKDQDPFGDALAFAEERFGPDAPDIPPGADLPSLLPTLDDMPPGFVLIDENHRYYAAATPTP